LFYNDSPRFCWQKPDALIDTRSAVVCSPNNFQYDEPLDEGMIRVTVLANFDRWQALGEEQYRAAKRQAYERMVASAERFVPPFRSAVIDTDVFTPKTIRHFTGHENGAVYGAPQKQWDGSTHLENLFVCGTDQGYVGIVGAMIGGISVANRRLLRGAEVG
jgi:phytoene dehydrogenase-like protein